MEKRNKFLGLEKSNERNNEDLSQKCRNARNNVEDEIAVAKGKWVLKKVEKIKLINPHPKNDWNHFKVLREGITSYHDTNNVMKFKDDNGNIASADEKIPK